MSGSVCVLVMELNSKSVIATVEMKGKHACLVTLA